MMTSKKVGLDFSNLVELLGYRAEHQRDEVAYIFLIDGENKEARLTYGELDTRARGVAAELQKKFSPGERALLLYPSGLDFICAFWGCLYAGIIAIPVEIPMYGDINAGMKKLGGIIENSTPKIAMTTKLITSMINMEKLSAQYTFLKGMLWMESDDVDESLSEKWQKPDIKPETLAFLQYTSGSTGAPKGVINTHGKLLYNSWQMQTKLGEGLCSDNETYPANFPAEPADFTHVTWLPLFHDMGLIANIIHSAILGCLCVVMSPEAFIVKPLRWPQAISKYKARVSWAPNFAYELCAKRASLAENLDIDLSSWLIALNAAEPVRIATIEKFYEALKSYGLQREALYVGYGLAEATIGVSGTFWGKLHVCSLDKEKMLQRKIAPLASGQSDAYTCVSCGFPVPEMKVTIANPETCALCPPDEVGEIWLSGSNVCQGYWNNEQASKEAFSCYIQDTGAGPFLRTGDLGFMRNGELFITGRNKDLIIIRGKNHYPQDIELTVEKNHPTFRLGCCAAFPVDVENEERLVVIQEIRAERIEGLDALEATSAIRKAVFENHELQVYAIALIKPGTIPKTSSGKIRRKACRELFLGGCLEKFGEWKQDILEQQGESSKKSLSKLVLRRSIEDFLILAIAKELAVEPDKIDLAKPLTDYWLGSEKIIAIAGELGDWLGTEIPFSLLFDSPTIAELAKNLSEQQRQNEENFGKSLT